MAHYFAADVTLVVLIEYDHASVTFDLVISECTWIYVKNACPNIWFICFQIVLLGRRI